jgi:hypothetical protein
VTISVLFLTCLVCGVQLLTWDTMHCCFHPISSVYSPLTLCFPDPAAIVLV